MTTMSTALQLTIAKKKTLIDFMRKGSTPYEVIEPGKAVRINGTYIKYVHPNIYTNNGGGVRIYRPGSTQFIPESEAEERYADILKT